MNFFKKLAERRRKRSKGRAGDVQAGRKQQEQGKQEQGEGARREAPVDAAEAQKLVMELCEQMAGVSRELAEVKQEYQVLTSYLTDVQRLEDLPEEQRAPIVECASHVAALDRERSEYLKTERKLSDTQFAQMQEVEDELPDIVRRLKANERDLDVIRKDMSRLEGEKIELAMQKSESEYRQKVLRKAAVCVLAVFATLAVLFGLLALVLHWNTQIPMMVSAALAAAIGVGVFVKYQDAGASIRRAEASRNRAITLENHVKIKYVNAKNAVDYTCEKYHVRDSRDLTYLYEQYQEELRELEKLRKTSDELDYYMGQLVKLLRRENLYDAQVWLSHANAIVDSREMVEIKHDLITRRQKLRARIEYDAGTITDMKKEALRHVAAMGLSGQQERQIMKKIESLGV